MKSLRDDLSIGLFSLVFPGTPIDESKYIDIVSNLTASKSTKITLDVDNLIVDLEDLFRTQEEPFESLSIYGQYKIMELAHIHGFKVLLDGQGGDELFCGYPKYYSIYFIE